jgi:signal transduction histidine kinase
VSWSVRTRITALATAIVLLVLVLTGAALVAAQRTVLTDSVDEVLQRHSAEIASQIDTGELPDVISGRGDEEAFARVIDSSGTVTSSTADDSDRITVGMPSGTAARFDSVLPRDGGVAFRVMSQRHGDLVIVTGTPLDDVDDSVATLVRGLTLAVPAASLLLALLVWLLVGRVLRPVEKIRSQVAGIGGSNLDRRVPEPGTRDEIDRLARTMNEMLARLESSSDRQRRFVADASHELRTPLARIRAELEVDLAHPGSADLLATHRKVLEDADALERLVNDLLTLARGDVAESPGHREPVDLDDVVLDEVWRLGAPVDISGVSAAQVPGDSTQLARVVRNLLENAVQHGGSKVSIVLREEGPEAVLTVTDDGPGIPGPLRERVFERFARADEARTTSAGGVGLGLAIARALVVAHDGTIAVDPEHPGGARFVVRLPLYEDSRG